MPDVSLSVQSYSILRYDRPTHGGGVMLLVKNNFTILECHELSYGSIQVLYADIQYGSPNSFVIRVVCRYQPPNTDITSSLLFLSALEHTSAPLHITK